MKKTITYGGLVLGVLALSTSAIFVKLAHAPSSIAAFYRLLLAWACIAPLSFLRPEQRAQWRQMTRRQWCLSMLSGVLLAIHYILWFESLRYTSVASSTVIVTLQPLFSMALGYLFLRERQTRLALAGCAVALLGSFIIGLGDFQNSLQALLGDMLALVAAGVISGYFFVGQLVRKNTSAAVYSTLGYGGSVVFLALYSLIRQQPFAPYPARTWLCFLGLALISTVLGQYVFNLLLKWLSATTITMSILGEPIGTCLLAYLIFGETIGLHQGVGIVVMLGGLSMYFYSLSARRQTEIPSHPDTKRRAHR